MTREPTVVAIGCSGPVAQHFVDGFSSEGAKLRILPRRPVEVRERFPDAEIVQGSMIEPDDQARFGVVRLGTAQKG